ncbi:hypothetical protein QUA51_12680 [Microcoleus sp. Pol10_D6]|uniref:hypothetical protein n=1 Tax=unclassified Microcoleus TaxID=2642155 RepID=UPI002FD2E392
MNTKKRKPLGSAMEEFVFGTKEAASPTPPELVSSAPTPTASLTSEAALPATPPGIALPTVISSLPEVSAPAPVSIQSKEPSLMSKLQAPDKEATVRFTVDMSETLHRKLSMLAAKTARKKVDSWCGCCWKMGLRRWRGKGSLDIVRSLYSEGGDRSEKLTGLRNRSFPNKWGASNENLVSLEL